MSHGRPARDLEAPLARLVAALRDCYAGDLLAVVLYGSAAVGDFVPGASDVNVLVLLRTVTPAALRLARRPLALWPVEPPLIPLLLAPEELAASRDVFPIELQDMRDRHRVLWGEDPFSGLVLRDADVRRQLETELRGKWLRLRQAYLRDTGDATALRSLMRESLSSFQVLFAAALRLQRALADKTDSAPDSTVVGNAAVSIRRDDSARPQGEPRRAEVFARAWEAFGLNAEVLARAVAIKEGGEGWPDVELEAAFERYLECVAQVLDEVDRWGRSRLNNGERTVAAEQTT